MNCHAQHDLLTRVVEPTLTFADKASESIIVLRRGKKKFALVKLV
jgi:tyrosyl-tRNA synthetase